LSTDLKAKIKALGFDADEAFPVEGGYIVEGDIFLSDEDLSKPINLANSLTIAEEEQYHTTNLVTGLPRTITISKSGNFNQNISTAITNAVARYNAQNLGLTFQEVSSNGNINVRIVNGGGFIASAGFPTSGGDPYNEVQFNRQYRNWNVNTLTTVFAHEFGHCIGFRHTDYMNRSYSCGSGGNEGDGGVGAIHIPGTPTGPDAASWMLACIGNGTNRPFNANDVTAPVLIQPLYHDFLNHKVTKVSKKHKRHRRHKGDKLKISFVLFVPFVFLLKRYALSVFLVQSSWCIIMFNG
jgi:hypothetical protein